MLGQIHMVLEYVLGLHVGGNVADHVKLRQYK